MGSWSIPLMEIGRLRRKYSCTQEEKFILWYMSLKISYPYRNVQKSFTNVGLEPKEGL